ncbi:MAG: rhodanese-like domain-containing protein [Anaerolineae bacterium]|jgi:hypothetical protein
MSKKRKRRTGTASAKKKRQRTDWTSNAIPIVVGLVVVVIIVGAIISLERRQSEAFGNPGGGAESVATAQPLSTSPLPYPDVPRISLQEAQQKLNQGQAVLIDVRSKSSYDKAHAAGALSIPEAEISARLDELPHDKDIVLYCT